MQRESSGKGIGKERGKTIRHKRSHLRPSPSFPQTGFRSRDAAAAALTSHAISSSPYLAKVDSFASSSGGLAAVSEDDECFFDARSDDGGGGGSGADEGAAGPSLGSFGRRAGSVGGAPGRESAAAPGFFAGIAAAVAARLGFGDGPSSPSPPTPAAAAAPASSSSSPFAFPWFSLHRSASSHSMPSAAGGGDGDAGASPFAAAAATPGLGERDRHSNPRRSLSLNPRPVAGPGGQPSMELAPGVVVPADVVLQPEPSSYGSPRLPGGDHGGGGVVVPGACMPLLSLARESLGARGLGLGGHHLASLRRQQQQQRTTFVQTVRPNAGDSGLRRAPEYESESESADGEGEGEEEEEEEERGGEVGAEAASSSSPPLASSPEAATAAATAAPAADAAETTSAEAKAAEGGKPQWHRRFDWSPTSPRKKLRGGKGEETRDGEKPPAAPFPPFLTETYGPCDATTFKVRSKDYLRSKVKQASPAAIYELVAADLYSFDFKISHIAKHVVLPALPVPSAAHAALQPHNRLPPLLVLNIQLPTYPASIWGGGGGGGGGGMLGGLFGGGGNDDDASSSSSSTADGRGHSLVFYFRLPDNWDPTSYERSHPAAGPALGLARRFVHNGREGDGTPTRDRLKLIARVANPAEWGREAPLSGAETRLLASYNDKPLLTRPQHKFFHGPGELSEVFFFQVFFALGPLFSLLSFSPPLSSPFLAHLDFLSPFALPTTKQKTMIRLPRGRPRRPRLRVPRPAGPHRLPVAALVRRLRQRARRRGEEQFGAARGGALLRARGPRRLRGREAIPGDGGPGEGARGCCGVRGGGGSEAAAAAAKGSRGRGGPLFERCPRSGGGEQQRSSPAAGVCALAPLDRGRELWRERRRAFLLSRSGERDELEHQRGAERGCARDAEGRCGCSCGFLGVKKKRRAAVFFIRR